MITLKQLGIILIRVCKKFGVPVMAFGFIIIYYKMLPSDVFHISFMLIVLILSFFDGVIK